MQESGSIITRCITDHEYSWETSVWWFKSSGGCVSSEQVRDVLEARPLKKWAIFWNQFCILWRPVKWCKYRSNMFILFFPREYSGCIILTQLEPTRSLLSRWIEWTIFFSVCVKHAHNIKKKEVKVCEIKRMANSRVSRWVYAEVRKTEPTEANWHLKECWKPSCGGLITSALGWAAINGWV